MRSLRLDPELDRRVRLAAELEGESVSQFLREAAETRVEQTLGGRGRERFADVAGSIHGGGGRARSSGRAFADALSEARSRR